MATFMLKSGRAGCRHSKQHCMTSSAHATPPIPLVVHPQVLEDFASVWGNRPAAPAPSSQSLAELDLQSVQRVYHTHQT
jgi:hypothetical protein